MHIRRAIGALALLTGCSAQPALQPISGTDTYVMTGRSEAGDTGVLIAQYSALEDARNFCASHGRRFRALGDRVDQSPLSNQVSYTVQFRCPPPGAPELERPTVNQAPDDRL